MTLTRAHLATLTAAAHLAAATEAARVLAAHGVAVAGAPASWPRWLQVEVIFAAARRGAPW